MRVCRLEVDEDVVVAPIRSFGKTCNQQHPYESSLITHLCITDVRQRKCAPYLQYKPAVYSMWSIYELYDTYINSSYMYMMVHIQTIIYVYLCPYIND